MSRLIRGRFRRTSRREEWREQKRDTGRSGRPARQRPLVQESQCQQRRSIRDSHATEPERERTLFAMAPPFRQDSSIITQQALGLKQADNSIGNGLLT